MELDEAEANVDAPVEYRAFTGSPTELGVITDVLDGAVLVQFLGCTYARRVHPRDLSLPEVPAWAG